ncbi:MAG: DUF4386 domain-containing protein [Bacteroidales bacterium]|jgi:hypothetical protein|nr:DUF4386 domain-containing protein [Bacteroidales bacterium]
MEVEYNNEVKENKRIAGIAGIWYLLFVVTAGLCQMYLIKTFVAENAEATAQNILATESLYLLSIFGSVFGHIICFLFVVLMLYRLLKHVNETQAKLMFSLVLVAVAVMFINIIFQANALFVLNRAAYFKEFTVGQIYEISTLFLQLRFIGEYVTGILWGLWLFPLAYLVYKSNFIPKIIACLLILAGICHIADCVLFLTNQRLHAILTDYLMLLALGEIIMFLWLLIKGVSVPEENETTEK